MEEMVERRSELEGREMGTRKLSSGHDTAITPMNSPKIWLSTQDLHNIKPIATSS